MDTVEKQLANIVIGGTLDITGNVIGSRNLTAGNLLTAGRMTATGNVTGGNILSSTDISAVGNVSGVYLIGNGSLLTGIFVAGSTGGARRLYQHHHQFP